MTPEHKTSDLRREIDLAISAMRGETAGQRMDALWRQEPGPAAAAFLVSRLGKMRGWLGLSRLRVAVLRSFTLEPAIPLLRAAAFGFRLDIEAHLGDYNAYVQEILDQNSPLYRFAPDAVILAVRLADIAPELWQDFAALGPQDVQEVVQRATRTLGQVIASFRERSQAALIVHGFEQPVRAALGVLDSQIEMGQAEAIQGINRELRRQAREYRGVYVLDYDQLVARHGRLLLQDERKFLTMRLALAAHGLIPLVNEWLRFLVPLSGRVAKVIAVDLDNTLWGGVLGEEGMTGIRLGAEYPGAAYQSMQRVLLDLSRRGILLAICSKNNREEAMEAVERHPGMVLRPGDFAAIRINWEDKSQGLREIAAQLNLGLDSIAFLDDSPFEREQVRRALPEVLVIDLPEDPMQYAAAVRECPAFERLNLSLEDRERTFFYAKREERAQAEKGFESKEEFYRYLGQEARIEPATSASIARIAQLTQKTNQFNLTTRRYSEQQIAEMSSRPGWQVLSIQVKDRFGDHGLVGVTITHDDGDACEIDTLLLSCRVIGRSVEMSLLSHVAREASARGRTRLQGWFLPTRKNAPAAEFYARAGFECRERGNEGQRWTFNLENGRIRCPEWIRLTAWEGEPV